MAHYNFSTGIYSKAMPTALAQRFIEAAQDPDLLSMQRLVGVEQARLTELLSGLDKPGGSWQEIIKADSIMNEARRRNDVPALRNALNALSDAIRLGAAERERWEEIQKCIDAIHGLVDSIQRHQVQGQQVITLIQLQVLFTAFAKLVREAFIRAMAQAQDDRMKVVLKKSLMEVSEGFLRVTSMNATPTVGGAGRPGGGSMFQADKGSVAPAVTLEKGE